MLFFVVSLIVRCILFFHVYVAGVFLLFCFVLVLESLDVWHVCCKVRKRARIRNQYNQAPHLTQETNRIMQILQLDITNESQEVRHFPAGDHKASINRSA